MVENTTLHLQSTLLNLDLPLPFIDLGPWLSNTPMESEAL